MKPARVAARPNDPIENPNFGYSPELEPEFKKFEAGLDTFSRSLDRDSWFQTFGLVPPPPGPWNATQREFFRGALKQAPAALAAAPYITLVYLLYLKDMTAEHGDLSSDFWGPLQSACDAFGAQRLEQQQEMGADNK